MPGTKVEALAEPAGISLATLRAARENIGVMSTGGGPGHPYVWSLPSRDAAASDLPGAVR